MTDIYICRDRNQIEIKNIVGLLRKTDWATDREESQIEESVKNSTCYGVFDGRNHLIGFARIITDFVTTFYLMDVVIEESYRGQGIGKILMNEIMKDVGHLYGILHTDTAQKFYEAYGFVVTATSESGESIMEKRKNICSSSN